MERVVPSLVFVAMCLCGCSLSKHLARTSTRVEKMYADTVEWERMPIRTITWEQALSLARKNSLELKDADDEIENAKRQALSIYTDLIPGVSYYGYMTRSIAQLSDSVSSDDLSSSVNVTFSIPALTQVPYRVYSSKARLFAAMKAKEGRYRELVSKLYRAVREREVEMARDALEKNDPTQGREFSAQKEQEQKLRNEKYWQELAQLIGVRNVRWQITPTSMPHVKWEDYEPRLNRLGNLVVCNFAMRLEQARMAQYGVALNYLPTINTSLYSPSLFSSTGGTYSGTFLDEDDTRLNLSISYSLDTRLSTWNSYQQSKARYEREKIKVADELRDHRNRIYQLRQSMREYTAWHSFMSKQIDFLKSADTFHAEDFIEQAGKLYSLQVELLNQEGKAIESEAALVLEYGMPNEPDSPSCGLETDQH